VRPIFGYNIGDLAAQHVLFDGVWIDSTSTGLVVTATAATDTSFSSVVGQLTNGVDDNLGIGTCDLTCDWYGWPESNWFNLTTHDFAPASITSISLRVDVLHFGLAPLGEPIVYFHFTVTVYGTSTVPVVPRSWGRLKALYR